MFYYGIHSERFETGKKPEEDGYMGSGADLKKAQDEIGLDKFTKTVIKTFSTRDEARLEEMIVVDEDMVNDPMCYNIALGGGCNGNTEGFVPVDYRDKSLRVGKYFMISCEEYWKNPEKYIIQASNHVSVIDKLSNSDNFTIISKEEYHKNKERYLTSGSGIVIIKKMGSDRWQRITVEEYYNNKKNYITTSKGKVPFKNKDDWNDIRWLDPKDSLVLSGQFIGLQKGVIRSDEFRESISGEKNGTYGSFWITDGKVSKKVKNQEIPEGWRRGRTVDSYIEYVNLTDGNKKYFNSSDIISEGYVPSKFVRNEKLITQENLKQVLLKNNGSLRQSSKDLNMSKKTLEELVSFYKLKEFVKKN